MNHEKSMKKFMIIWSGQFFSILGSAISAFGLSVWILEKTSNATSFATAFFLQILPGILFAPIAGSFADRRKRKSIILWTDTLDACLKASIIVLLLMDWMRIWMVYPFIFLSSVISTFQIPAFQASIPLIVPKEALGRANGLIQLVQAVQNLAAPILAGTLYPVLQLSGLFVIDFLTFFLAIFTLLPQRISQKELEPSTQSLKETVFGDLKFSIRYLREKTGFLQLIAVFAVLNFLANAAFVLLGPLVMGNYDPAVFGAVNSASGVAMIAGGLLAGIVPAVENRIRTIFFCLLLCGAGLIIMGLSVNWIVIAVGLFLFMLPIPYVNGTFGTIMQTKFETEVLGRVGSVVGAMLKAIMPIAAIGSGLLADHVFIPLLEKGGRLEGSWIAALLGAGEKRGIGMMFILCGVLLTLLCVRMLNVPKVMQMEKNLPDVLSDA